jgi:hypothetical protein
MFEKYDFQKIISMELKILQKCKKREVRIWLIRIHQSLLLFEEPELTHSIPFKLIFLLKQMRIGNQMLNI